MLFSTNLSLLLFSFLSAQNVIITKFLEYLEDLQKDSSIYTVLIDLATLFGLWSLQKHMSTLFSGKTRLLVVTKEMVTIAMIMIIKDYENEYCFNL